jgi:hypothetical protein
MFVVQVTRLLDSFIDPSQLLRQAEFITWLGSQRDLLVRSFEEERQRWEAEREGWDRMAEALLAQQAKTGITASGRDEEVEHKHNICESENKALREKVRVNTIFGTYGLLIYIRLGSGLSVALFGPRV